VVCRLGVEQNTEADIDGGVDDRIAIGQRVDGVGGQLPDEDLYAELVVDGSEPGSQGVHLVVPDVKLGVVLADEEPAGNPGRVAEDDVGGASASDELRNPGAEAAAAPDMDGPAGEGAGRPMVIASGGDLGSFVGHRAPFDW
jgi:hypothetical protein